MATPLEWLGGAIYGAKNALGLGQVNLFPGDVAQKTLGQPASSTYGGNWQQQINASTYANPVGVARYNTLGASTQAPSSGRVSSTGSAPVNYGSAPMEGTNYDSGMGWIDEAINSGLEALNQYQGTLQPAADLMVQEAETSATQQKTEAQGEQTRRLGELGTQRTTAETKTGSAVAEARRMASQLQQGIQSRYGGSTHVGGAVSEVMGSQATANIATNRAALQETLGKITVAEEGVRSRVTEIINQVNQNLELAKEKARTWLNQALADVAVKKGELEASRATMRLDAIQSYNALISDIEARNTAYKQELYNAAQAAAAKLASYKQTAVGTYEANTQAYQPYGMPGAETTTTGTGAVQGSFNVPSKPKTLEEILGIS